MSTHGGHANLLVDARARLWEMIIDAGRDEAQVTLIDADAMRTVPEDVVCLAAGQPRPSQRKWDARQAIGAGPGEMED